jgi:hypothetical protein
MEQVMTSEDESMLESEALENGRHLGKVIGGLVGGAAGLGLCIALPIIPIIVGTVEIAVASITAGGKVGAYAGEEAVRRKQ